MREDIIVTRTVEDMERVDFSRLNSRKDVIGFNTSHDARLYIDYREIEWFKKIGKDLLWIITNKINTGLINSRVLGEFEYISKGKLGLIKLEQQPKERRLSLFIDYFHDEICWYLDAKEQMRLAVVSKDACIQDLSMSRNSHYRYPDTVKDRIKRELKSKTDEMLYSDSIDGRGKIQYLINDLVAIEFLKSDGHNLPTGLSSQILNRESISFSWFLSESELAEIDCSAKGIGLSECRRQCASLANYSEHSKLMKAWFDMMYQEMGRFGETF